MQPSSPSSWPTSPVSSMPVSLPLTRIDDRLVAERRGAARRSPRRASSAGQLSRSEALGDQPEGEHEAGQQRARDERATTASARWRSENAVTRASSDAHVDAEVCALHALASRVRGARMADARPRLAVAARMPERRLGAATPYRAARPSRPRGTGARTGSRTRTARPACRPRRSCRATGSPCTRPAAARRRCRA